VRRSAELHGASFGIGVVKPLIAAVALVLVVAGGFVLVRRRRSPHGGSLAVDGPAEA
jgi:hypothetical protein